MRHESSPDGTDEQARQSTAGRRDGNTTRRGFLKAAGAATVAAGVGSTLVGNAAARGIPTPWLHRDGNLIKDPSGNKVVLRGVNVVDPARGAETAWRRNVSKTVEHATDPERGWNSRIIRIPIQPGDIAQDGKGYGSEPSPVAFTQSKLESYLETYLDPVIQKCKEVDVYAIVDYHRHRSHGLEYTNSSLDEEVQMFWETVAPRYAEESHVLYEVYNEPISPYIGFRERGVSVGVTDDEAEETWNTWKEAAQPWVDTIRENAPRNLILIGSPRWSQWTYWSAKSEFEGDNLAYTGHVYGHPNLRPLGKYFGEPSKEVPIFMTEFGWDSTADAEYIAGTPEKEGQQFTEFFEEYDSIHWQVWCFDYIWSPTMFDGESKADWNINTYGEFFKKYLAEKRDADLPGDGGGTPEPPETTTPEPPETTRPEPSENGTELDAIEGTLPQDTDGDGLYEDINANGRIDSDDVVQYFRHKDDAAITDHVSAYDYNDNGRIDYDDVATLFSWL